MLSWRVGADSFADLIGDIKVRAGAVEDRGHTEAREEGPAEDAWSEVSDIFTIFVKVRGRFIT